MSAKEMHYGREGGWLAAGRQCWAGREGPQDLRSGLMTALRNRSPTETRGTHPLLCPFLPTSLLFV